MSDDFTPRERAALDRMTVPAMRSTLTADIVSQALAGSERPVPPRRPARGGWRRRGVALASAGALLLASAAAATTGLLDRLPAAIPAIASAIGVPMAKPKPKPVHVVKRAAPRPAPGALPPPVATPTPQTLAERAEQLRAQRIDAGLPVMSPKVRAAVRRRIQARLAALPPGRRAELRDKLANMTPEQRANTFERIRENVVQRRPGLARRIQARRGLADGRVAGAPGVRMATPPVMEDTVDAQAGRAPTIDRTRMIELMRERRRARMERRWRQMNEAEQPTGATEPPANP